MIKVVLKDKSIREYEPGTTYLQIAENISRGLAANAVLALADAKPVDLNNEAGDGVQLEFVTFDDELGRDTYRHTSSHILAQAVQRLFPGTKLGIGPSITDGFYYDFDSEHVLTPEDFVAIEKEMEKIIKENLPIQRREVSKEVAIKIFSDRGEIYKVELVNDLPQDTIISIYYQGDFLDLCAGPHLPSTGRVKSIKIMNLAGAYWRGSEKNKMLQRIYATSFPKKAMLDEYLFRIEEAKKRDHRKIGQELELFTILEDGPGFPFFLPKGMVLRNELENFWREEHRKSGYMEIKTPIILNRTLWERSGHWDNYKENMYFTKIDELDFAVKPMNCPGGMLVYKTKLHSYRELPIRMAELGLVHRHEMSGALHGLMRVRNFTQDDAHIFMLPEQIKEEIKGVIDLIDRFYKIFGFEYHVELSTKPENAIGSDETWEVATTALEEALKEKGMEFKVNPGDGAFYGPKIDFHLRDCLGRTWQCGTIQLDFQMPERFDLNYVGEDGQKHRPVMIHRVVFGSIERFIGILTEHYAGAFPVWLSPVQVKILPITDKFNDYAIEIQKKIEGLGIRVEGDYRNEKIGFKIREAQLAKVPYMFVIGEKEVETSSVAVRQRGEGDKGSMGVEEAIDLVAGDIAAKR